MGETWKISNQKWVLRPGPNTKFEGSEFRHEKQRLGGGFKYFLEFSPLFGEDSKIWLIFFKGVGSTRIGFRIRFSKRSEFSVTFFCQTVNLLGKKFREGVEVVDFPKENSEISKPLQVAYDDKSLWDLLGRFLLLLNLKWWFLSHQEYSYYFLHTFSPCTKEKKDGCKRGNSLDEIDQVFFQWGLVTYHKGPTW